MEKEFVPFELAVKLKMLGFACDYSFKEYDTSGVLQHTGLLDSHSLPHFDAPLWQQAFEWFRIKDLDSCVYKMIGGGSGYDEVYIGLVHRVHSTEDDFEIYTNFVYDTYEQARLACLEKLIELVSLQKPCS